MATSRVTLGTFKATPKIREYIGQVLDSGRISYGPFSQQFEREFAHLHDCQYGVLSNSGTSSLLVALQTLKELHGWPDGSKVVVPAITFVATVNIILQNRLTPVLCDVEPDYYGLDLKEFPYLLARHHGIKCIIPVHTFGQPVRMADLLSAVIRSGRNIKVIEDSCEAMFVNHCDRPVGSWGDIACFSTYVAHLLTTGVGGIATTSNPDYARTMRSLVNHGMSYDDLSGGDNGFTPTKTRRDFVFDRIGHSFRLTEFEAALGLAQLETYREMIAIRQRNAAYLSRALEVFFGDLLQLPALRPDTGHAFMMYPIVCKQPGIRDRLTRYLEERGIETRRMLPLTCQPVYKGLFDPDDYPVAKWINANGFYVGCHQGLTVGDLDYVAEAIGEFYDTHG